MEGLISSGWFLWLREHWLFPCLVLFFAALSLQYTEKVGDSARPNRSAFLRWRDQILELDDGVNIWEKHNYPNPPIMAMLLKPLVLLPPVLGSLAWFYLKSFMAVAAIFLAFQLVETPGQPWPSWTKALAVALSIRPIMGDLSHGNINLFILLLCVGALYCFRLRRDLAGGMALGLAIACKLTPALLVPYFLWKRCWKLVASCCLGLALFLWLVPGLYFGFEQNQAYLLTWHRNMIRPFIVDGTVTTDYENQSLPGLIYRMVTDSASFSTFVDDQYVPLENHNLVTLDRSVATAIVKVLMAAFAVLVFWVCRTSIVDRERWQLAAEYGLILIGMLLFSERTWKHHCVTMLVPFCVLCYVMVTVRASPRMRHFVIAMLIVAAVCMAATASGWSKSLDRVSKLAQVYGAYVWANLALASALAALLYEQRRLSRQINQGPRSSHTRTESAGPTSAPPRREKSRIRDKSAEARGVV
jgi:alpha-1,2-mannosyltransferase